MASLYYDREGRPIALMEFARLLEDPAYKRVAEDTLPDGRWLSTVWLGIDHRLRDAGLPVIFETMLFESRERLNETRMLRACTEAEARRNHERIFFSELWISIGEVTD